MDRQIIYSGQIPLDTDLLNTNKNAMIAIGKLAGAALGTTTVVNGLAVSPTSPTSLSILVAPGEIYALQNMDNASYGSLASDTTNQLVKQGIVLATTTLSCPAPGTAGQSINYLIQAAFSETDTGAVALPYYNATNPATAWSGVGNNGTPQVTARQNLCVVTVIAGTAAATGSQTTPTPTGNAIGLAVVTVANGQANITGANISQYAGASLVPQNGLASNIAHALYSKNVGGAANVTLTDQEAAYPLLTLTGALTGNINLIVPSVSRQRIINNQTTGAGYNITVKTAAGTGLAVPQGQTMSVYCDGVNVLNSYSASLMPAPYADATGTSDAITAAYIVNNTVLYDGYPLALGITAPNTTTTPTFAPTLNGYLQTAHTIVKFIGNVAVPLAPGDLQGDAEFRYDLPGTRWVLQNPSAAANTVTPGTLIDFAGTTAPTGYLACPTAATNISRTTYAALFAAIGTTWGIGTIEMAGSLTIGVVYTIYFVGSTDFTLIGASSNTVGVVFTATGVGTGTGKTLSTFGIPWFPADYAAVQANANVGTSTVGVVLAHTHATNSGTINSGGGTLAGGSVVGLGNATASTMTPAGGTANLAAGIRVLKCVKY